MIAPTLLNVTNYWVSGGADVLSFLRMGEDGNNLRLVCTEMRDNVQLFPWMEGMNEVHVDSDAHVSKLNDVSSIRRCVPMWRRCYPNAKVAHVRSYKKRARTQRLLVPMIPWNSGFFCFCLKRCPSRRDVISEFHDVNPRCLGWVCSTVCL